MKTAGELLSLILDEKLIKKIKTHSALSSSWPEITAKNRIPAAADHSRILDLVHGILQVETDHPGWLQIFSIKQEALLAGVRARFPNLAISGIAFRLSHGPLSGNAETEKISAGKAPENEQVREISGADPAGDDTDKTPVYEKIQDENFRAAIKKLEQSILSRQAPHASGSQKRTFNH
jgi:hypothetical protein